MNAKTDQTFGQPNFVLVFDDMSNTIEDMDEAQIKYLKKTISRCRPWHIRLNKWLKGLFK